LFDRISNYRIKICLRRAQTERISGMFDSRVTLMWEGIYKKYVLGHTCIGILSIELIYIDS